MIFNKNIISKARKLMYNMKQIPFKKMNSKNSLYSVKNYFIIIYCVYRRFLKKYRTNKVEK